MKIITEIHGLTSLLITDDKTDLRLVMEYDAQLERYQIDVQDGDGQVQPQTPVRRVVGESDQIFFDRACLEAHRHYTTFLDEKVSQQSRCEQLEHLKSLVRNELTAIEQDMFHGDNDEPSKRDLERMNAGLAHLRSGRDAVSDAL